MTKIKLLFFENEFAEIKPTFDVVSTHYYGDSFEYKIFSKSQDLKYEKDLFKYDFIFVDIDLSGASELDGHRLMEKIKKSGFPVEKLAIISGHEQDDDILIEYNLTDIRYIDKPIKFAELLSFIPIPEQQDAANN